MKSSAGSVSGVPTWSGHSCPLAFDFEVWGLRAKQQKAKSKASGQECPLHTIKIYCPVPLKLIICVPGFAESVTVIAPVRLPIAVGVKTIVKVHFVCAASVPVQGVAPPGAAA